MNDYVKIIKDDKTIHVCFYIDSDRIMTIGEKINAINDEAYMNGYNWEAFFNYYLVKNEPDLMEVIESDPEASMYVAYFDLNQENDLKAKRFVKIIHSLIENEEYLYQIIKEEGSNIEWD